MIRVLLTLLLSLGLVFAMREWKQSRVLFSAILTLTLGGIFLVWFDGSATAIANALGVGRGADLVLYVSSAISFVLVVSLLLRIKRLHEQLTEVARAVAIANPVQANRNKGTQEISHDSGPHT